MFGAACGLGTGMGTTASAGDGTVPAGSAPLAASPFRTDLSPAVLYRCAAGDFCPAGVGAGSAAAGKLLAA